MRRCLLLAGFVVLIAIAQGNPAFSFQDEVR
jgi:hypothetical protein